MISIMAPGAFAILAPFLGRKKKYEKLETDDPEKKKQEATQEEIERLNFKIKRLMTSMSRDDFEPAMSSDEECMVCGQSRAVMQVAPCGHQSQCRLCFVNNIQEAVATRDLPLRCLICNTKILRVKNNSRRNVPGQELPVHGSIQKNHFPKSVSAYSLGKGLAHSDSSYSMSSGISNMSTSSLSSNRSVKSTTSLRSSSSVKSLTSNSSWFSLGSFSNFQAGGGGLLIDKKAISKPPRAHSLCTRGKSQSRGSQSGANVNQSSNNNLKQSSQKPNPRVDNEPESENRNPLGSSYNLFPSPKAIDNRIRAIQGYARVSTNADDSTDNCNGEEDGTVAPIPFNTKPGVKFSLTRSQTVPGGKGEPSFISDKSTRRHSGSGNVSRPRFSKSPDLAETTFTMTTIHEEDSN